MIKPSICLRRNQNFILKLNNRQKSFYAVEHFSHWLVTPDSFQPSVPFPSHKPWIPKVHMSDLVVESVCNPENPSGPTVKIPGEVYRSVQGLSVILLKNLNVPYRNPKGLCLPILNFSFDWRTQYFCPRSPSL